MSTVELADWISKLVTAYIIKEVLTLNEEDDSNSSQVGKNHPLVIMEVSDK